MKGRSDQDKTYQVIPLYEDSKCTVTHSYKFMSACTHTEKHVHRHIHAYTTELHGEGDGITKCDSLILCYNKHSFFMKTYT